MSRASPPPQRFSEGLILKGVEIFAAGTHRGKTYNESDLRDIASNFRRFSVGTRPYLRVPGVLGHEETQEFLERSDLPAAAWAENVWVEGRRDKAGTMRPTLLADLGNVPPKVANLIRSKRYRTVSAEIYDHPPEGIPGTGKMLRRVAFLGGDIPQVKDLDDIPMPEAHAESGASYAPTVLCFREAVRHASAGYFTVFSEVTPMDRNALIQALTSKGFDVSLITDLIPDSLLAEVLRVCDAGASAMADDAEPPEPKDEQEKETYRERARKFFDRARKFADRCGMKLADMMPADPVATTQPQPGAAVNQFTGQPKQIITKYSEGELDALANAVSARLQGQLQPLADKVKSLDRFAEERAKADKRALIKTRLDTLVAQGKVLPSEIDAGLADTAYALDATTIHRYSEGGKLVEKTPLDRFFGTLEARPPLVRFGETVGTGAGKGQADAETEKVEEHFEQFREQFGKVGLTKDKLVGSFKAEKALRPDLTASEFLNKA